MKNPNTDVPSAVTKSITEHGGLNQYGKPYWRVILAHNHVRPKLGTWIDWPDGTMEQFVRDPKTGQFVHCPLRPNRIVYEVRETPMWPVKGWILERWFPAAVWGDPETWRGHSPYPEQGEYYLIAPAPPIEWKEMPALYDLKEAISMWERSYLQRPTSFQAAYAVFNEEERRQTEREEAEAAEALEYAIKHDIAPIFNSSSLEGMRLRNELCDMLKTYGAPIEAA